MYFLKNLLYKIYSPKEDELLERIEKNEMFNKYVFLLGSSIALLFFVNIFNLLSISQKNDFYIPITIAEKKNSEPEQIITLPYAHQSFKTLSSWVKDAVVTLYTFNFNDFDQKIIDAEYYFTRNGYETYINALELSNVRKDILEKKIISSIIPLNDPILINSGTFGNTEFWRFRINVLISFVGGKEVVNTKKKVELVVLRVPSYENYKGLGISQVIIE